MIQLNTISDEAFEAKLCALLRRMDIERAWQEMKARATPCAAMKATKEANFNP